MGIMKTFKDTRAMSLVPRVQLKRDVFMPRPERTGGGEAPTAEALEPVAGVSLDCYAAIVRGIAAYNYDQSLLPSIAADHGIAPDEWRGAHQGWNARIQTDAAVARRFSDIYHS